MHSLHVDNWGKSLQVQEHELHGEVQMGIIKLCENSEVVIQTLDYIFHRRKILKDK